MSIEKLTDQEIAEYISGLEDNEENLFFKYIGDAGDIGHPFYQALLELRERREQDG